MSYKSHFQNYEIWPKIVQVPLLFTLPREGRGKEERGDRKMICSAMAKNRRNGLKLNNLLKISLFSLSLVVLSANNNHGTVMRTQ